MPPLPPSFNSWLDYYRYIVARFPSDVDPLDRDRGYYQIIYKYFDSQQGCEVKHELLLWQLKWLCWDEIQPMLPTRYEAATESDGIGHALANTYIPPRDSYKTGALLEFLYLNQQTH